VVPTYIAYFALTVCLLGTLWRMGRWFAICIGPESREATSFDRIASGLTALMRTLFSRKSAAILVVMVADVVSQRRIFKQNLIRWAMHMGLFYGVLLLTGLHALDNITLARLTDDYASTRNPYMLLRNLLGLVLFAGVAIALLRRRALPLLKRFNAWPDRTALLLCALILMSGVALEAVQIISASIFDNMVDDYMGSDDPEAVMALKGYWAQNFDVAFELPPPVDDSALALGRQLHADYCAACHSRPTAAIMAYPLAKAIKPLAAIIECLRLDTWLWYFHYLAACLALAFLPFGKFFHLVSVPLNLALGTMGNAADNKPLNRATRRAVGLDACTHCGVCSRHCSVAPIMAVIDNPNILPSEKIGSVRRMAGGQMPYDQKAILAHGGHICTACGRCTDLCPSGIDLQDLWQAAQIDLADQGFLSPHGRIGRRSALQWAEVAKANAGVNLNANPGDYSLKLAQNPETFWACVQCTTCTTVCPVVAASDNPRQDLDFTPQQVMNLMRLELKEMALGWEVCDVLQVPGAMPPGRSRGRRAV
jgi:ferredoxin/nitrate reductase gamma subunit